MAWANFVVWLSESVGVPLSIDFFITRTCVRAQSELRKNCASLDWRACQNYEQTPSVLDWYWLYADGSFWHEGEGRPSAENRPKATALGETQLLWPVNGAKPALRAGALVHTFDPIRPQRSPLHFNCILGLQPPRARGNLALSMPKPTARHLSFPKTKRAA